MVLRGVTQGGGWFLGGTVPCSQNCHQGQLWPGPCWWHVPCVSLFSPPWEQWHQLLWRHEGTHSILCVCVCVCVCVCRCVQLFATSYTSSPGSSVHGISQARILEWVAISFSRGSSWPKDRTHVSCIAARCFTVWARREATWNPRMIIC